MQLLSKRKGVFWGTGHTSSKLSDEGQFITRNVCIVFSVFLIDDDDNEDDEMFLNFCQHEQKQKSRQKNNSTVYGEGTDIHTHRHTHHNTSQPLPQAK